MQVRIVKGQREDVIEGRRNDGSSVRARLPHKGPVPHDVTHLIVEKRLGFDRGFWGKVASGADPEALGAMARAAGHASAKRASTPDADFVEIIQAERVVESFEAELWSDGADNDGVRSMAAAGCAQSLVPMPVLGDDAVEAIRADLRAFRAQWSEVAVGDSVELHW